mmetsp:Transcript_40393/g.125693  ORF Transcript_40393/g.125693 Transcript_40393/m.125693 type:complete len:82 (-) Transcript_40393:823-1068(-)
MPWQVFSGNAETVLVGPIQQHSAPELHIVITGVDVHAVDDHGITTSIFAAQTGRGCVEELDVRTFLTGMVDMLIVSSRTNI